MARPTVPLINKEATLEAALRIIDREGMDALSIRRLAAELNVTGSSLYHHFKDKDEILAGVVALALEDVRVPEDEGLDWRDWLIRNADSYRRVLLEHPGLIPVLLKRHPLRLGMNVHEMSVAALERQGVPQGKLIPVVETLEQLALGMALYQSAIAREGPITDFYKSHPRLRAATDASAFTPDDLFPLVARAAVDSIVWAQEPRR